MKFRAPTTQERHESEDMSNGHYQLIWVSEGGVWGVGFKKVIFGMRVIAYELNGGGGCAIDYCAADNPKFAIELASTVMAVMTGLPEGISSNELYDLMPKWTTRPINNDPCWPKLKSMAERFLHS